MSGPELCQFGNKRCLCQTCETPCNGGLTCWDCESKGEAAHDIYMCTGHTGPKHWHDDWPWNTKTGGNTP